MEKKLSTKDYLKKAGKYVVHSLSWPGEDQGTVFESASGAILKDTDGREYIDAISGTNGPLLIGHSHPALTEALTDQSKKISHTLGIFDNIPLIQLCEKLESITPSSIRKSYICTGGGASVEAALKLIMKVTGRGEFLSLHYSYHGLSLGTMSLGGIPSLRDWVPGGLRWPGFQQVPNPYCYRCPFGAREESCELECAGALRAALGHGTSGQVAAFIFEVCQGPGGHISMPQRYVDEVVRICREKDVLIIVDEVQTGLGRCGSWFCSDLYNLKPDVVVIGKAMGGGYPIGAASFSEKIATKEIESVSWHSLTFQNDPLGAAVGLAVLGIIEKENLINRANVIGKTVREKLVQMSEKYKIIGDIRGPGLFIGIELVKDRKTKEPAIVETLEGVVYARENGLVTFTGGAGNVLKIKPPLVITDDQVERMMDLFDKTFNFIQSRV